MQTAEIIGIDEAEKLPQERKIMRASVATDYTDVGSDKLELTYPRLAYVAAALAGVAFWWGVFSYF